MTARSTPRHRLSIRWQRRVRIAVAGAGACMMLLLMLFGCSEVVLSGLCGGGTCAVGWYVDLLKATLVLPPFAALLFACSCLFFRTGMVGRQLRVQVLAFSVVVIVWVVALEILRYVEDVARF